MDTQEQLAAVIEQLGNDMDNDTRAGLEQKKAVLTMQLEDAKTQEVATQERILAQEEKIESIILPYNFDEVFDDQRANLMIIELIKDFQRQAYDEHNQELNELATAHREELRAATDRELQLKRQNDELQQKHEDEVNELEIANRRLMDENTTRLQRMNTLESDLEDVLSKRDAAVREKEGLETLLAEKQEHIDKLREEIAIGAKAAVNVTNISPSDRLATLVQESKNAKVKSALDIALENAVPFRGPVIKDGQVVAPLDAPQVSPFPVIDQTSDTSNHLVTGPAISLPTVDQAVDFRPEEVQAVPVGLVEGNADEDGKATKTVEERLTALELKVFGA